MTLIDWNGLDSTVHGPVRLGVLALLKLDGPLDFTALKKRLGVTDGVLGAHLIFAPHPKNSSALALQLRLRVW